MLSIPLYRLGAKPAFYSQPERFENLPVSVACSSKGETRLASRPAVIVGIADMDALTPDNEALHDETFKRLVVQAIRDAIEEWAYR